MGPEKTKDKTGIMEDSINVNPNKPPFQCDRCGSPGDPLTNYIRILYGGRVRMCEKCNNEFLRLQEKYGGPGASEVRRITSFRLVAYRNTKVGERIPQAEVDRNIALALRDFSGGED